MASKVIKIKIGTDVHQMVDNKGEKIGCYECSLFNMCSRLGNSQTPLCNSLIKENALHPGRRSRIYRKISA